jgi:hypothetical protein
MENLTEALKYALPSVVVFLTAYLLLRQFFRAEENKRNQSFLIDRIRISLPIRLQAYERIILFLERISPQNLVMRLHKPELDAAAFHKLLVDSVREEFSHNLSQQLYISVYAWELVKNAKEDIIRQINTSFAQLDKDASATDLGNKLLEMSTEKISARKALDYLKAEAAKAF